MHQAPPSTTHEGPAKDQRPGTKHQDPTPLSLANGEAAAAVLFSAGLDSAVLLAYAAQQTAPATRIQPIYVSAGLAWEREELAMAERLFRSGSYPSRILPLVALSVDMRDVYPATHWAIRGDAPAFDTPDEDVYIEGRNIVLLSKAAVYLARARISRVLMGPLAGNPFPDATPAFFGAIATALSLGLAFQIRIEAPFASMHKADVIRLGRSLGVPLELTLSCMQAANGRHCGRCSKCRERMDGFREAGVPDSTPYATG
jgi:7-cyano-7-deazaguanine synthase